MKLPKSTWFAIIFGSMALVGLFLKDHGDGYPYIYRDVVVGSVLMYGSVGIMVIVGIWFNGEEKEYVVWEGLYWKILAFVLLGVGIFSLCASLFVMSLPTSVMIVEDSNFGTMYEGRYEWPKITNYFIYLGIISTISFLMVLWKKFTDVDDDHCESQEGG